MAVHISEAKFAASARTCPAALKKEGDAKAAQHAIASHVDLRTQLATLAIRH
jgi:hypothetical protein